MEAVFLAGAVQALFFAIIVLNKKDRQSADSILGIWLTTLSFTLFSIFLFYREGTYKYAGLLSIVIGMLASQPVWFYLYTCSLTDKSKSFKIRELVHFIPVIAVVVLFIPFNKFDAYQIEGIYNVTESIPKLTLYWGIPLIGLIYVYIILSLIRIRTHKRNLKYEFSYEEAIDLKWLLKLTYSFIVIFLFSLIMFGLFIITGSKNGLIYDYLAGLSYVGFVFALGYFGHKQGKIFSRTKVVLEDTAQMKSSLRNPSRLKASAEENAKLATQLNNYTNDYKPWLNPQMSLYDLASELNITSHQLTSLLNDYLKTNFYDYINHHRVEEVKRRLKSNNNRFTILAIALECGFNSKASFNRIFKQKTGSTPSEYMKLSQH